jgi:hypothetical protein
MDRAGMRSPATSASVRRARRDPTGRDPVMPGAMDLSQVTRGAMDRSPARGAMGRRPARGATDRSPARAVMVRSAVTRRDMDLSRVTRGAMDLSRRPSIKGPATIRRPPSCMARAITDRGSIMARAGVGEEGGGRVYSRTSQRPEILRDLGAPAHARALEIACTRSRVNDDRVRAEGVPGPMRLDDDRPQRFRTPWPFAW